MAVRYFKKHKPKEADSGGKRSGNGSSRGQADLDGLVRAAMKDSLSEIVRAIQSMIERTPPDVRSEILKSGIYLTGGLARSHGLPAYLRQSTGLLVTAHKNPELCAVKGLRTIIFR